MKRGLVLEGGGMRGMFTAGVIDVMMEQGIEYAGAVGVSAGAVFGCNYKSRQIGRAIRYNLRFCKDPRYCSVRSLMKTGDLFGTDFCYRQIPNELDPFDVETYRKNPMEFYVVTTDVLTGQPLYHLCPNGDESDLTWFRASASMPLAANVVEADGRWMLDGGIVDSIPLKFAEGKYHRNVVVLTQPIDYIKKKNKAMPLVRNRMKQYPKVVAAMARRHEDYNREVAYIRYRERAGKVFVLRPEAPLDLSRTEHDPAKLLKAYDHGRAVAEKRMAALKEFLNAGGTPNER